MNNYLNHNRDVFKTKLNKDDYWDFHLSCDTIGSFVSDEGSDKCISSFIDTEDPDCVWFEKLFSKNDYVWEKAFNKGVVFENIGYTGVDNGLINYRKDRTSNEKFLNLFLNSKYEIKEGDVRLTLTKVNGNNQIYSYKNDIVEEDGMSVARLNGGFYQGFWKSGCDYQVFDDNIDGGWGFEFILKKEDLINEETTLNDVHKENKGMFFYMGTRSENKWWLKYDVEEEFSKSCTSVFSEGYVNDDYFSISLNADYASKFVEDSGWSENGYMEFKTNGKAFADGYVNDEYQDPNNTDCCNNVFDSDYLSKELEIDVNMKLETSEGYDLYQPNIVEYRTDNKFIFFNKTDEGFNVNNWDKGNEVILTDIKVPDSENYFMLMDKTCNGYNVHSIDRLTKKKSMKYDVLKDLYRNAFGLQIKDDGSIGYKYLVKNCENNGFKIESEFSNDGIVSNSEWVMVDACINRIGVDKMRLSLYVNGKLVLVSKELPIFNFKKLDDLDSKQEAVPYNISLGGGTQGLCDVVYLNFRETPKYSLPLENEFGGTFIGYFKSFKSYSCQLKYNTIVDNYEKFKKSLKGN